MIFSRKRNAALVEEDNPPPEPPAKKESGTPLAEINFLVDLPSLLFQPTPPITKKSSGLPTIVSDIHHQHVPSNFEAQCKYVCVYVYMSALFLFASVYKFKGLVGARGSASP